MDKIIQSAEYNRLSKYISPHLLILHEYTSGQELISLISPSTRNLFQLEIKTQIEQELPFQTYLLQHQSSINFQKDFNQQISSSSNSKIQILQIEIHYLQTQHAEAIALGDFTQQLAVEQAISNKLQTIEYLQEKQKVLTHEESFITNKIDQQIHELLKTHMKSLRKRIRNNQSQIDQKKSLDKQTIYSVKDLRQLNNELKKSRQENNRQQQIDIQLQILDKIEQLDKQSIDQNILQNLRQQLHQEQEQYSLLISSSNETLYHTSQIQILPISSHISESSWTTVLEETKTKPTLEQTMTFVSGNLLAQTSSIEQMNISLVTNDAKELYEELQKMRYSIETTFEDTQILTDMEDEKSLPQILIPIKSDVTIEHDEEHISAENINTIRLPSEYRRQSSSIEIVNSSLFSKDNIQDPRSISSPPKADIISSNDEKLSSPLLVVGNARKYSITQTKTKDQQIATSTQRSFVHSQRDYGKVYTRHRLVGVTAPAPSIDEENLRNKVKGKTRLVKFQRTKQGNTVIHRQLDVSTRTFIVPQQANYEENLEPVPPLIHVNDVLESILDETNRISLKSKRSSPLLSTLNIEKESSDLNKTDYESQKSEMVLPFHSATILSPIKEQEEEEEEIETTNGIAFSLTNQDSSIKKYFIDEKEKIPDIIMTNDDDKLSEKSRTIQQMPSSSSTMITSSTFQTEETIQKQKSDENKQISTNTIFPSLLKDFSSTSNISKIKTPTLKEHNAIEKKSSKKKHEPSSIEQTEDVQPMTTNIEESFSTQGFDVESESQQTIPITPENKIIYHKVGGKLKSKKKTKKTDTSKTKPKTKLNQIKTSIPSEPLVLTPRKAVPFISATKDKQIIVEEDIPTKPKKKKKRKRSTKSNRQSTRSRSSDRSKSINKRKKKTKRRVKKELNVEEKIDNNLTESKPIKNQDAIAMHLLNVERFTGPPISAINIDQSRSKYDDIIEISNEKIQQSRLKSLKPMIKNFEFDNQSSKSTNEIHLIDTFDLNKKLFDFNQDTKDIDQPAMFTEYIPDFFQKQAEEKQIRRISLTAIHTNEQLTKHLAPRISRLYNGWQPTDTICVHTNEFHPLNKYLISDLSYYFDEDFLDESGLFHNKKYFEKFQTQIKQPTQRFRDDYIIKEFFNCWKNSTTEKARIAELRRKRLTIDFREFWFQDAFSDPFYSYFQQPIDYIKKQIHHHQMAYRLHKRLVRTGREQPKETMNEQNRSSFLPILFNLPKNYLDRQESLTRRRQLINYTNENNKLTHLITNYDDVLSLIRERLNILNRTKNQINIHNDEFVIKQRLLNSSLLEQGTIEDLDQLIMDYYISLEEQDIKNSSISSHSIVKLPLLKQSSNISKSSHRIETF